RRRNRPLPVAARKEGRLVSEAHNSAAAAKAAATVPAGDSTDPKAATGPQASLSSTGPQASLAQSAVSNTGTYAAVGAAGTTPHATLNTKPLFKLMVEKNASDLFFTSNAPIKIKIQGQILPVNKQVLTPETVRQTAYALMSAEQREYFTRE